MARVIYCECGYVARAAKDDDVVADIEDHIASDHPALAAQVSRQDILGWVVVED